jgi:phospholipid transport system substrate-binding protein
MPLAGIEALAPGLRKTTTRAVSRTLPTAEKPMTHPMRLLTLILAAAVALLLPLHALAAPAQTPEAFIKAKHAELNGLLKQGKPAEPRVEAVFDQILDYDALAKDSLGPLWNERSEAERKEFQGILKKLVQRAYKKNLKKTLDYAIEYKGAEKRNASFVVRTVAKNKKNAREEPISIDYALHEVDGKWKIRDIVTEGSSLVNNYKSQFRRVIKKDGFAGLIAKMKKKLDAEGA